MNNYKYYDYLYRNNMNNQNLFNPKEGFEKGISEYMTLSIARFGYSPRHFVDPNSDLVKLELKANKLKLK